MPHCDSEHKFFAAYPLGNMCYLQRCTWRRYLQLLISLGSPHIPCLQKQVRPSTQFTCQHVLKNPDVENRYNLIFMLPLSSLRSPSCAGNQQKRITIRWCLSLFYRWVADLSKYGWTAKNSLQKPILEKNKIIAERLIRSSSKIWEKLYKVLCQISMKTIATKQQHSVFKKPLVTIYYRLWIALRRQPQM